MATTTLYLQNAAPPYTPTTKRGAWDDVSATTVCGLGTKSGVVYAQSPAVGSVVADFDKLVARFVSSPLTVDLLFQGTIDGVVGVLNYTSGCHAKLHLHVFVLQGQTDVLRGTLWGDYIGLTEVGVAESACGEGFSGTLSTLQAYAGDTVVVEVGGRCNAGSVSDQVEVMYGSTGAVDLVDGGSGLTQPGWVRLTYTESVLRLHVERKTEVGGTYAEIADVADSDGSYLDTHEDLVSGTRYYYRNRYSQDTEYGSYSPEVYIDYAVVGEVTVSAVPVTASAAHIVAPAVSVVSAGSVAAVPLTASAAHVVAPVVTATGATSGHPYYYRLAYD
jgi:hypothetical protein